MMNIRTIPKLATLVAAAAVGLTACADDQSTRAVDRQSSVPVSLEVSSQTAKVGARIAVAVKLDAQPGAAGGIQGAVEFDPTRLRYVGQTPQGTAISVANAKGAAKGSLRFGAFNPAGITGRVALFVFETKTPDYMSSLRYVHQSAGSANGNTHAIAAQVMNTVVNSGLDVPADAAVMTVADWAARLVPSGTKAPGVSVAPGEYRTNLKYGDIDFSGVIDVSDYLAVANAAVGNDEIIIGTDGPSIDRDLVIAGNVFPTNTAGACGTETDGSRVLEVNDYLAIANKAIGNAEACAGNVIPGRGPLPTNVVTITGGTSLSGPDLCTTAGQVINWTKSNIYRLDGTVRVGSTNACTLNIEAGTTIQGVTETQAVGRPSTLYIYRGSQIFAVGSQNEPVVFSCTAAAKVPGCWGGLWISGRARINTGSTLVSGDPETGPSADGGCNQQKAEAGNAPGFGGCNDADNSGRLSYVRIEYGGFVVQPNRELNNLTLSALGSGTIIDHVQAHGGLDDGIEFFGGRVNTSYIVSTGNNDDGFDTDFGYDGTTQFLIIANDQGNNLNGDDSRAFESDNAGSSSQALPRTNPRIYNATVTGFNVTDATKSLAAIMLRRGSSMRMYNSLLDGYQRAITLRDNFTCSAFGSGDPVIENTTFLDMGSLGSSSDDANTPATACAPGTGTGSAMEASFLSGSTGFRARNIAGGTLGLDQVLFKGRENQLPDFRMRANGANPQEAGTSTVAAGLVQTNYRGAVGVLNQGQIPWYSGWTRGWQSATAP
jgi:hypothetical protein